jgi:TRAP-type transport system periplasmic protein
MLTLTHRRLGAILSPVLALLLSLLFFSCDGGSDKQGVAIADKPIRMKIAHSLTENTHCHKGLVEFKRILEEKAPGAFDVQLFSGGQLGDSADLLGRLKSNSVQACLTANAPLSNFEKKLMLIDLPFFFPNAKSAETFLDGPMGKQLAADLPQKAGIRVLAYWVSGFRSIFSSKGIHKTPADLQGISIRVMETDVHKEVFAALGANPRPMAFGELYPALQQGVVDAAENDADAFFSQNFYEVCKYYTLTNHVYTAIPLSISEKFYQSLTPELRKAVEEAAAEARDYERTLAKQMNQDALTKLKEKGVTIEEVDNEPFAKIARTVYPKFEAEIGTDILKQALETVQSYQ